MENPLCGCVVTVLVVALPVVGVTTCSSFLKNRETARIESEYLATQNRAAKRLHERNQRVAAFVSSVNPALVERLREIRQSSVNFTHLIKQARALQAEFPEHHALLQRHEAKYHATRDSLVRVGNRIEHQLAEAYLNHELLKEQGGYSFPALTQRLLRDAEGVLRVANEVRSSMEQQAFEVPNEH